MSDIPETMKAAVTHGAPRGAHRAEFPCPTTNPTRCWSRSPPAASAARTSISTRGHMRPMWPPFYPFIQGHEWAGEVAAIGSGAKTSLQVGDRVIMEPTVGCGACATCIRGDYHICENAAKPDGGYKLLGHTANGAFSEYGLAPPNNLHKMPDSMKWEDAVIVNQVVIALHALERGGVEPADTVAILGPGLLGLAVLQLVKMMGASKTFITGRGYRLGIAEELGADRTIDITKEDPVEVVMNETDGRGVDLVIECAGPPEVMRQAVDMARRGGRVVLEGINGGQETSFNTDRIGARRDRHIRGARIAQLLPAGDPDHRRRPHRHRQDAHALVRAR